VLITRAATFDEIHRSFRWRLPERYNIARDVCDRHATGPERTALIHERGDGSVARYTFQQVQRLANQCANLLRHLGLVQGDRAMIYLGQDPATAVAHVACWKSGLISVPTSILFGTDALAYRLRDSGARLLITDAAHWPVVAAVRAVPVIGNGDITTPGAARHMITVPARTIPSRSAGTWRSMPRATVMSSPWITSWVSAPW